MLPVAAFVASSPRYGPSIFTASILSGSEYRRNVSSVLLRRLEIATLFAMGLMEDARL